MTFLLFSDGPGVPLRTQEFADWHCAYYESGSPWLWWDSGSKVEITQTSRGAIAHIQDRQAGTEDAQGSRPSSPTRSHSTTGATLVSVDGEDVRIEGSVCGSSVVAWSMYLGRPLASNSALMLASLVGAGLDSRRIALDLASYTPLHAFQEFTHWEKVRAVPPGSALCWDGRLEPTVHVRWVPELEVLGLEQAGARLRSAFLQEISRTSSGGAPLSADLSGGLDSGSIVYGLCHAGARPVTFHANSGSPWNDDHLWAQGIADELELQHSEISNFAAESSSFAVDAGTLPRLDQPPVWLGTQRYLELLAERLAGRSGNVHLVGIGGDELFGYLPAALHVLARGNSAARAHARRFRRLNRWPMRATRRALSSRSSVEQELVTALTRVREPAVEGPEEELAWGPRPTIAPWVSRIAEELIGEIGEGALEQGVFPHAQDRLRHQMLESVRHQGSVLRQIRVAFGHSSDWEAPFLEQGVIEAALSLRSAERFQTGTSKPLLAEATKSFMPRRHFERPNKGEYSYGVFREFDAQRVRLLEFFQSSRVRTEGFIDFRVLSAHVSGPASGHDTVGAVERLVGLERWLEMVQGMQSRMSPLQYGERDSRKEAHGA